MMMTMTMNDAAPQGTLKLADLGLMTTFGDKPVHSNNVVTLWYRSPELLLGATKYGPEVRPLLTFRSTA